MLLRLHGLTLKSSDLEREEAGVFPRIWRCFRIYVLPNLSMFSIFMHFILSSHLLWGEAAWTSSYISCPWWKGGPPPLEETAVTREQLQGFTALLLKFPERIACLFPETLKTPMEAGKRGPTWKVGSLERPFQHTVNINVLEQDSRKKKPHRPRLWEVTFSHFSEPS